MKISYVLPVYNAQSTIAQTIQSLLKQSVPGEIIVINDGSDDNTARVLQYYDKTGQIHVESSEIRQGAAYARNIGNEIATGDIIAVCDADIYYKDRGKAILEFFEQFPEKDIFYSSLHLRYSDKYHEQYLMEAYAWDFSSKCPISHPTVAYRKKVAEHIQYQELSIETDLYEFFLLDAHRAGHQFGGCQNPLMLKMEGNSRRKSNEARELKRSMYKEYGIQIE